MNDATEFDIRGELAAALTCWHRLTCKEATELVAFVAALRAQPASPREASDFQKWSVLAYRVLDDAGRVLMTVEPECSTEYEKLSDLEKTIRELMYQALTLNGVLSRRDMDRKSQLGKLDSDALLRAQPDHSELIAKLREECEHELHFETSELLRQAANALEGI